MATQAKTDTLHDYLAIIPIGCGSSWGRSSDKEDAIKRAIAALRDWTVYYDLSNIEVTINVVSVQGYKDVDSAGGREWSLWGVNETNNVYEPIKRKFEHVKRITPKYKSR